MLINLSVLYFYRTAKGWNMCLKYDLYSKYTNSESAPTRGPFGRDEAYIHESCCLVVGFIKRPSVFLIWADKKLSRQKVKQVVLRHAFRLVPV